jgi:hypothetical protein
MISFLVLLTRRLHTLIVGTAQSALSNQIGVLAVSGALAALLLQFRHGSLSGSHSHSEFLGTAPVLRPSHRSEFNVISPDFNSTHSTDFRVRLASR